MTQVAIANPFNSMCGDRTLDVPRQAFAKAMCVKNNSIGSNGNEQKPDARGRRVIGTSPRHFAVYRFSHTIENMPRVR